MTIPTGEPHQRARAWASWGGRGRESAWKWDSVCEHHETCELPAKVLVDCCPPICLQQYWLRAYSVPWQHRKRISCHPRTHISLNRDDKQTCDIMSGRDDCSERPRSRRWQGVGRYFTGDGQGGPLQKVPYGQRSGHSQAVRHAGKSCSRQKHLQGKHHRLLGTLEQGWD